MHTVAGVDPSKSIYVKDMFGNIAKRYDLLNSLLSLGIHRSWKRRVIELAGISEGSRVLDICAGTSDIAILAAGKTGTKGLVSALDFCLPMLVIGKDKANEKESRIGFVNADAMRLPYRNRMFDAVTVGFGIRNVEDIKRVFDEVVRVLKPGGAFVCLEFSHPRGSVVRFLYGIYSKTLVPMLGRILSKNDNAYEYLPDSIRRFHDQEALLKLMKESGFGQTGYENKSGGIVAIHYGKKQ